MRCCDDYIMKIKTKDSIGNANKIKMGVTVFIKLSATVSRVLENGSYEIYSVLITMLTKFTAVYLGSCEYKIQPCHASYWNGVTLPHSPDTYRPSSCRTLGVLRADRGITLKYPSISTVF